MTGNSGHTWSIDSIEEGMARIEEDGGRMLTVPVAMLPTGAKEGQMLRVTMSEHGGESVPIRISIDHAATAAALKKSAATTAQAMKNSAKRDPGGDVTL